MIEIAEMDQHDPTPAPSAKSIQMTWKALPITIHGSNPLCSVLGGWGNPARMLHGIGARQLLLPETPYSSLALEMAYRPIPLVELHQFICEADVLRIPYRH